MYARSPKGEDSIIDLEEINDLRRQSILPRASNHRQDKAVECKLKQHCPEVDLQPPFTGRDQMATIGAAVSAKTKAEFETAANIRATTASRLAASLIENFLKQEAHKGGKTDHLSLPSIAAAASGRENAKTEQVHVRLEPFYFSELGRLAQERHWYRGTYLGNLFRAHLDRRPILCDAEINAVRQVVCQLADMGRNINQVARKLNTSLDHAHLAASIDFELVRMLIELETNAVKDLIKANVRGWGVSDVEA